MQSYSVAVRPEFLKCAVGLSKEEKAMLVKVLWLLGENFRHPSLQSKRVKSAQIPLYECRVDQNVRLIYDLHNDRLRCLYVGNHDEALRFAESGHRHISISPEVDDIEISAESSSAGDKTEGDQDEVLTVAEIETRLTSAR
jgi:mRNA-degrading endonuclease YafQ of YafQ-DinJ toxin-antitoxin module